MLFEEFHVRLPGKSVIFESFNKLNFMKLLRNRCTDMQLRWSIMFGENESDLLTVILHRYGIQRTFETIMNVYECQVLDPYVNRKKFRDEWFEYDIKDLDSKKVDEEGNESLTSDQ